jgi:hypothetical protein
MCSWETVFRICMFSDLLDPDLFVGGSALGPAPDPYPFIIKQK